MNLLYLKFFKKINFSGLKSIFFLSSLIYFCIYFFYNIDQISFDINLEKNGINLFLSFLFCILSIYLNAYAWKYIVRWFGKEFKSNNLVSFYVLTNILKYVTGGIWHFVERFNFIKKIYYFLNVFISFWIYFMEIKFDPNNNKGYLKFNMIFQNQMQILI